MTEEDEIRVRLLGRPQMTHLGLGAFFPDKGFQLIALTALYQQRRIARKTAATFLWDKIEEAAALNNLRQLLARMRQQCPELGSILSVDARNLSIAGNGKQIDVIQFLESSDSSLLELYQGSFLEGLGDVSQTFAEWVQVERARLQEQFFRRCELHLLDATRLGRSSAESIAVYEARLLALEPEREATFRLLIEAYGRCGHTREAARVSRAIVAIAKSEHGALPLPETEAAVRRVLALPKYIEAPEPVKTEQTQVAPPRVAFLLPRQLVPAQSTDYILSALIEDVANELARFRTFTMLAPHSSFRVDHDSGMPEDNNQLRADYTISGFVKPNGSLSLRIAHCESREIMWSGEYAFAPDVILSCFNQMSRRIAMTLAGNLERHSLSIHQRANNASAYVHYLQGEHAYKTCELPSIRRARKQYQLAVKEDSSFAEAHSGIANTLCMEWLMLGGTGPELLVNAKTMADRAIAIDPNSASGYWRKAVVEVYQHAFDESEESFAQAQELHPNHADIILDRSDALGHIGDPKLAQSLFERAIELNPVPPEHYWWVGAGIAFSNEDYTKSIELCQRLATDEPVLRLLAACHGQLQNTSEAKHYGQRLKETYPNETAYQMAKLQPHRSEQSLQPFINGLRAAGIK
jgi:DNA-binding SARP family transcriptional activator/Tfp pilus assembly protein PilF